MKKSVIAMSKQDVLGFIAEDSPFQVKAEQMNMFTNE